MKRFLLIIFVPFCVYAQGSPFSDRSTILNAPKRSGNYGVAVADFDRDGFDDIFFANAVYPAGTETSYCVLLHNNLGENFSDVTASSGIRLYGAYKCGVWGDVNNDGYPDLFVGDAYNVGKNRLFLNQKNGTFKDIASGSGIDLNAMISTAVFGDYDSDGRLDLFVATESPEYDILYRNISAGDSIRFQDVTETAGVGGFSGTTPMQATFIDIDHDGDADLYAVHDGYVAGNLFRNNGDGTFTDISFISGLYDYGAGNSMGLYWKDFDRDGWEEVYVSRIGKAGLYKRKPNGTYTNIADSTLAEFNGMTWGVVWEDFDNDGDDDLYMVNTFGYNQVKSLYYENDSGRYVEKGSPYGLDFAKDYYGLAYGDFNNDGYLDLIASATNGSNTLLMNTQNRKGNWVQLRLTGTASNRMAVGATVRFVTGSTVQRRTVTAGNSYASQMSPILHAGFGPVASIDTIDVQWPNGLKQSFRNVPVNKRYSVKEGADLVTGTVHGISHDGPTGYTLEQNFPNPFNPSTTIEFRLPIESNVHLGIFDLLGRQVGAPLNTILPPGVHQYSFDGSGLPSGVYYFRLTAGGMRMTRYMVLAK